MGRTLTVLLWILALGGLGLAGYVYFMDDGSMQLKMQRWLGIKSVESTEVATATSAAVDGRVGIEAAGQEDPTTTPALREFVPVAAPVSAADSPFGAEAYATFSSADVHVFAPKRPTEAEVAGFAETFYSYPGGYGATVPGETFDMIVSGTRVVHVPVGEEPSAVSPARTRTEVQSTEYGLVATFRDYGTDVQIQFECKYDDVAAPETVEEQRERFEEPPAPCLDESEARRQASRFVIFSSIVR